MSMRWVACFFSFCLAGRFVQKSKQALVACHCMCLCLGIYVYMYIFI